MRTFLGTLAAFLLAAADPLDAQIPTTSCDLPRSSVKRETEGGGFTLMSGCLEAKPKHEPAVVRGGSLTFDVSPSTGKIRKYKWTLVPQDCPEGPGEWSTSKKKFTAQILCPMAVTLEVSDGKSTNQAKTTVAVRARGWKTETGREAAKKPMDFLSLSLEFGKNRCRVHPDNDAGDFIHFGDTRPVTWKGAAYWPKQVEDDGPFKDYWYIGRSKVQVVRTEFINSDLIDPSSTVYRLNAKNGRLADLRLIAEQVRQHERTHTDLMMEGLKSAGDPAVKIESLIHPEIDDLQRNADDVIRSANSSIADATEEDKVQARLRTIERFKAEACIFTADAVRQCFNPVANIGDVPDAGR